MFPLDRRLGMPEATLTPRVERNLLERLANDDYRRSAKGIEVFGCTISHVQAGRVFEKAGTEVHSELYGPEATLAAGKEAPKNPAELFIVEPDGARLAGERRPNRRGARPSATGRTRPTRGRSAGTAIPVQRRPPIARPRPNARPQRPTTRSRRANATAAGPQVRTFCGADPPGARTRWAS